MFNGNFYQNIFFICYQNFVLLTLFFNNFVLFIYFWPCWVFTNVQALLWFGRTETPFHCSARASRCGAGLQARGLRSCGPQALEHRLSVVVARAHSSSATCGVFPGQASNSRLWHWQVDSLPLSHQGSLNIIYFKWRRKESFIPFILPE